MPYRCIEKWLQLCKSAFKCDRYYAVLERVVRICDGLISWKNETRVPGFSINIRLNYKEKCVNAWNALSTWWRTLCLLEVTASVFFKKITCNLESLTFLNVRAIVLLRVSGGNTALSISEVRELPSVALGVTCSVVAITFLQLYKFFRQLFIHILYGLWRNSFFKKQTPVEHLTMSCKLRFLFPASYTSTLELFRRARMNTKSKECNLFHNFKTWTWLLGE